MINRVPVPASSPQIGVQASGIGVQMPSAPQIVICSAGPVRRSYRSRQYTCARVPGLAGSVQRTSALFNEQVLATIDMPLISLVLHLN